MGDERAATSVILGYYYQFDKTILVLLESDDNAKILVEGIEDIDVESANETVAIQCKYYESTKYNRGVIREPIYLMIKDFIERRRADKRLIKYFLYGYYKDYTNDQITIEELKKILIFKKEKKQRNYQAENGWTDEELEEFLKHFKMEISVNYETQYDKLIETIKKEFSCDREEAEIYYYNNMLAQIIKISSNKCKSERCLTKEEFINICNNKVLLFNKWFALLKGKDAYLKKIRRQIKNNNALYYLKSKSIVLDEKVELNKLEFNIVNLIEDLSVNRLKSGKIRYDEIPWTVVLNLKKEYVLKVKKDLIKKGIIFNDGYEEIFFNKEVLLKSPIMVRNNRSNYIKKISYDLKIISADILLKQEIKLESKVIFSFSDIDINKLFKIEGDTQIFLLPQVRNIKDIKVLLS